VTAIDPYSILASDQNVGVMPSIVDDVLFSEPSGSPNSLIQFATAVAFLSIYAVLATRDGAASNSWLLVMTVAALLSGIAESLPTDRRRLAGGLRLTATVALTCLITIVALAPELVTG